MTENKMPAVITSNDVDYYREDIVTTLEQKNARLVEALETVLCDREVLGWDSIKYLIEQALPKNKE
jgi:hypothetical protein